jgi:VCBS repeat-containing protein
MRRAVTDGNGDAVVELALLGAPGDTEVRVSFAGTNQYRPADDLAPFTIVRRPTELCLKSPIAGQGTCNEDPIEGRAIDDPLLVAALRTDPDTGEPLSLFEKTVILEITGDGGTYHEAVVTDYGGRAFLGDIPLPRGTYSVTASFGGTVNYGPQQASATLILHNSPPEVADDTYSLDAYELEVSAPGVTGNDSDRDGDPITASLVTSPVLGTVTLSPDGAFTYVPGASFDSIHLTDTFTYSASDGLDNSDELARVIVEPSPCFTAKATLVDQPEAPSIWPPNGDLVAVEVALELPASILITGIRQDEPVVNNEADGQFVDEDTVMVLAQRDGGGNGRVYHLLFTATDEQGGTCQGHVRLPVVSHDRSGAIDEFDEGALYDSTEVTRFAPEAGDDSAATDEDTPVAGNVLANDTDQNPQDLLAVAAVNGEAITVELSIPLPSGALLTIEAAGDYVYDPNGLFEGLTTGDLVADSFEYTVDDGNGGRDTATVTIAITGVNDAPYAGADQAATLVNQAVTVHVLDNDRDVDGSIHPASIAVVSAPGHGTATVDLVSGAVTYTPAQGFAGHDLFFYTVDDDEDLTSNEAAVALRVNDRPLANDDQATVDEDGEWEVAVLDNDTDDGSLDGATVTVIDPPDHGAAIVDAESGVVTYRPNANFHGADAFTYTVDDDEGLTSNEAMVTITVVPVNDPPLPGDDRYSVPEGTGLVVSAPGVLGNDVDVDGDPLSAAELTVPHTGTLSLEANGSFTYLPPAGFRGEVSFTYTAADGQGGAAAALVTITVWDVNHSPHARDDQVYAVQGTVVKIDVLQNDDDVDSDTLTVMKVGKPVRGTVQPNPDGTLTYIPDSSFRGADSFDYTISDGRGGTDTALVTITFGKK